MKKSTKRLIVASAILGTLAVGSSGVVGTTSIQAKRFNKSASDLPCKTLNLPDAAGAKPLSESICVAVSGEQPKKIGVESRDLGNGKEAHTLFMEWDFDGVTEKVKSKKPDAEPITLITEDGEPVEVHVRSHWRVGKYDFEECKEEDSGKVVVAVANGFHTPVVVSECQSEIVDPENKGGINSVIFRAVSGYARAVGQWFLNTFKPLGKADVNEVPGEDHPARSQPIFAE
jgi:hypothetical protein